MTRGPMLLPILPCFPCFLTPLGSRGKRLAAPVVFCATSFAGIGPCAAAEDILPTSAFYYGERARTVGPFLCYLAYVVHDQCSTIAIDLAAADPRHSWHAAHCTRAPASFDAGHRASFALSSCPRSAITRKVRRSAAQWALASA